MKKDVVRKKLWGDIEELWSERVSHSVIKYLTLKLIWLEKGLVPLSSVSIVPLCRDKMTSRKGTLVSEWASELNTGINVSEIIDE